LVFTFSSPSVLFIYLSDILSKLDITLIIILVSLLPLAFAFPIQQIPDKITKIFIVVIVLIFDVILYSFFMKSPPTLRQFYSVTLYLILVSPIFLFYLKGLAVVSEVSRAIKVGTLYLYDFAVLVWALQWLVNPYPAIFKLDYIVLFYFLIFLIIILILFGIVVVIISIDPQIFLFSIMPFIFNEELAARMAFCRKALKHWITIYPQKGRPVRGRIYDCSVSRIVLQRGRYRYIFSWSEIRWILR